MVCLINPAKPVIPQLLREVRKEVLMSQPGYIVIETDKPEIAEQFIFPGIETIVVLSPETQIISTDEPSQFKEKLEQKNIKVIKGKHLLQEAPHSSSQRYRTIFPVEIMAATLANLPESVKWSIENAVWAVDLKAIPPGSLVISIAGTDHIPDTAILLEPGISKNIIDTRIVKIICHPYRSEF